MKKTLSMLAIMSAILVSCEKSENVEVWEDNPDPEYSISISPSELIFGATGGEQTVRVTSYYQDASYSTIEWELYGESEWKKSDDGLWYCEAAEWCKVSMIEGGDGDKLSFIITSFNFGDTEKKCSFTLSCGEAEMEFTVTQGIDDSPIIQFSDPAFEKVVIIQADFNVDNKISEAEAAYLKELDLSEKELTDLSDIKYFINLTYLDCSYNQLTTLDLSKNIELIKLNCYDNQLTTLDVSNNTALTWLWCQGNQLTSLDLSKNTALTTLDCDDNQLTSLDVSNNTALTTLDCGYNQLTSLDLSKNTALGVLYCGDNQLTILDLRNNFLSCRYFGTLFCPRNPLERIVLSRKHEIDYEDIDSIIEYYGDIITYVD